MPLAVLSRPTAVALSPWALAWKPIYTECVPDPEAPWPMPTELPAVVGGLAPPAM